MPAWALIFGGGKLFLAGEWGDIGRGLVESGVIKFQYKISD